MQSFSMKDKVGYTLGDLGCCCTEQFRAMFLTVFYTLVLKVNPIHVGTIMLITKLVQLLILVSPNLARNSYLGLKHFQFHVQY